LGRSVRHRPGLGKNIPIATGNESDSLAALVDGKWIQMRVPYPIGYFAKGMDGASTTPMPDGRAAVCGPPIPIAPRTHIEGGKGQTSKVVHFQMRPDPLAN
jgi:hypothetical protein